MLALLPSHADLAARARALFGRAVLKLLAADVQYREPTLRALASGPTILLCNHVSYADGVLIALASPTPLVFGVDTEFSRRNPFTRWGMQILARIGFGKVVPLDQSSPSGLRTLVRELRAGNCVVLFPEGGISACGQPQQELPGASWLAGRTGCPVVRLHIEGAHRSRVFGKAGAHWRPRIGLRF